MNPRRRDDIELPPRCWDLDPDWLRRYGVLDDYDIQVHADAEFGRDKVLGEAFALARRLNPQERCALIEALANRHRSIWGAYAS